MTDQPSTPLSHWRVAGALTLVHVLCFILAVSITGPPTIHPGQERIEHSFHEGPLTELFTAGFVNVIGFLALLPVLVFLGGALGRRTPVARWAAQTASQAGLGFVVVIVGAGFAPGAAAAWSRARGLDLETTLAINNIQNFAYLLGLPLLALVAAGLGVAALDTGTLTGWVGWGGVVVGTALMLAIPAAGVGIAYGMPLWLLWWAGVGITLLRHRPTDRQVTSQPTHVSGEAAR